MPKENNKSFRNLDKRLDNVTNDMKSLYQTTYRTRTDNKDDMENIMSSINGNIDELLSKINSRSTSDISNLYIRLQRKSGGSVDEINNSIGELFNNSQLMNSIDVDSLCKSIRAEDYQYDLICKYMPKLEDALEIKKDNVLSSDNFTKDFINIISENSSKEFIQQFNDRANNLKKKYDFQTLCEEIYNDCSRYGEYFLYHVPYKTAFERLLNRKNKMTGGILGSNQVQSAYENSVVIESADVIKKAESSAGFKFDSTFTSEAFGDKNDSKVNLLFDGKGLISKVVEYVETREKIKENSTSLSEQYVQEVSSLTESKGDKSLAKGLTTDTLNGSNQLIAPDGFVDANKRNKSNTVKEILGSVIYKIPRDQIIPVCIGDDYVLGYIYFDVRNDHVDQMLAMGQSYNSLTNTTSSLSSDEFDKQNDFLIAQIAAQMSSAIDAQFINSNIDLKDEIYSVLRYNDNFCATRGTNNISVSFLAASDVHHIYFKKDRITHRGISDLKRSIVPGMLYCLLYLSDIISKISRSQDKRIYYVKQNIETNVAQTLLNVVNQIKKGNMGMRQLENMNSIFNIVGKYNDFIIPVGQSGDAPIQFEVMQGQQVDSPTELMDRMEESAINATEVPFEFVQSVNQVDFATRFTMSNTKFLRKVFKRQRICQDHFTEIFVNLYNFEYAENQQNIKILLPAPVFLTLTNSQQLIENNKAYATSIAEIVIPNEEEDVKQEFIALLTRKQLGTYIDFDMVDSMITESKHHVSYKRTLSAEVEDMSDDNY